MGHKESILEDLFSELVVEYGQGSPQKDTTGGVYTEQVLNSRRLGQALGVVNFPVFMLALRKQGSVVMLELYYVDCEKGKVLVTSLNEDQDGNIKSGTFCPMYLDDVLGAVMGWLYTEYGDAQRLADFSGAENTQNRRFA